VPVTQQRRAGASISRRANNVAFSSWLHRTRQHRQAPWSPAPGMEACPGAPTPGRRPGSGTAAAAQRSAAGSGQRAAARA
jgi:hypothetical protein